jgi:hypothetical protein
VRKSNLNGPGVLFFRPFVKASARQISLGSDSMHPWTVHVSWPQAELLRMSRRSCSVSVGRAWTKQKLQRFQRFRLHPAVLKRCRGWRPATPSQVALKHRVSLESSAGCLMGAVIPYRHELSSLPQAFKRHCEQWQATLQRTTGLNLKFGIYGSSGGKSLKALLSRKFV